MLADRIKQADAPAFGGWTRAGQIAAAVADWRIAIAPALCLILLLIVTQLPFAYRFQVGLERGVNSDLPYLSGFNTAELITWTESWRWSRGEAEIAMPGVGERPLVVGMNVISHRGQWQPEAGAPTLTLDAGAGAVSTFALRPSAARYLIYVPADAVADGSLRLRLSTAPWQNPNDARGDLGVALGTWLSVQSVAGGPSRPDLGLLFAWPLCLALLWLSVRALGFSPRETTWMIAPLSLIIPALGLIELPRLAFGAQWSVLAGLIALGTALLCALAVPPLLRRFGLNPPPALLRWLLLLMVMAFTIKFGGQFYPAAMPGDVQLHINRGTRSILGTIYIRAQHRGLPFPFPNGPYLMLAPLTLSGIPFGRIFEVMAGVFEATILLFFFGTLAKLTGSYRLGLIAAATYGLSAVAMANTWFQFHTQVAAQWLSALLLMVLVLRWPQISDRRTWLSVTALFVFVYMAHIGSMINTALLGAMVIPALWLRAQTEEERRATLALLWSGLAAGAFVAIFYVTAFWELISAQFGAIADQGMVELTGKSPLDRGEWLHAVWEAGLIGHYGLVPVLLSVAAAAMLMISGRLRRSVAPPIVWLTYVVGIIQVVIPLITLSSITTRWLTFASWAICFASAFAIRDLWRRGAAGRAVVLASYGFSFWLAAVVWIEGMALRKPPGEPF